MNTVSIGTVALGGTPRIVAIIDRIMPVESVKSFSEKGAALLEIRIDCFSEPFPVIRDYLQEIRSGVSLPVIGTIRETDANREERLDMFGQIMPLIDAVDIEIDADINRAVIAQAAGKTVIVSEHDFEKTPSHEELVHIVTESKALGAHIVKIAAMAHTREDVTRLLTFTASRPENLVTIAMGDIGTVSRIVAPLFGSLFTYAFVSDAVVPGQLPLEKVVEACRLFYPDFNA